MTDRSSLAGNSSWFHAWCLHPHWASLTPSVEFERPEKDIVSRSTKSSSCFSNCWDHLLKMPRSRQFLMSKPSFCCQENHFFFPPQRHPDFHFSPGSNGIPIRRVVSFLSSVALLGTSWCLWPFLGATSFDWQRYSARLPFRDLAFAQNRTLAIFPWMFLSKECFSWELSGMDSLIGLYPKCDQYFREVTWACLKVYYTPKLQYSYRTFKKQF